MWHRFAVALAIAALALGAGTAAASAKSSTARSASCAGAYVIAKDAASLAKASAAVACLVNAERAQRGLRAVRASSQLATVATGHSADMVAHANLSHAGAAGESVQDRVTRAGYRWKAVAETLTWGVARRSMPYRLVASFMQSRVHRAILLDRLYRDLGVGLVLGAPVAGASGASSTLTLVFASS